MTYSFVSNPAERYRTVRAVTRHARGVRVVTVGILLLPLLLIGVMMLGGVKPATALRAMAPWTAMLWLLVLVFVPLSQRWEARSAFRSKPGVAGEQHYELTPDAFRVRTPVSDSSLRWDVFRGFVETDDFLLFFYNAQCAYAIPRRVVPDADLPALRALVQGRVKGRVRLLGAPAAA